MNDIKVPPFTEGQKELIKMTEKLANGRKICDTDGIDDDIKDIKEMVSETITEIENQKQTNFQRITASPEALAEWLEESIGSFCDTYNSEVDCEKCPIADDCDVIEQKRLKQLRDNSTDNISISDKDYWLAWLKQESDTE